MHKQVMVTTAVLSAIYTCMSSDSLADTCTANAGLWLGNMVVFDENTRTPLPGVYMDLWDSYHRTTQVFQTDHQGKVGREDRRNYRWECPNRRTRHELVIRYRVTLRKPGYLSLTRNFQKRFMNGSGSAGLLFPYNLEKILLSRAVRNRPRGPVNNRRRPSNRNRRRHPNRPRRY